LRTPKGPRTTYWKSLAWRAVEGLISGRRPEQNAVEAISGWCYTFTAVQLSMGVVAGGLNRHLTDVTMKTARRDKKRVGVQNTQAQPSNTLLRQDRKIVKSKRYTFHKMTTCFGLAAIFRCRFISVARFQDRT